jgi:response regulator RpfG family c-di-GMP phosphodiesterase
MAQQRKHSLLLVDDEPDMLFSLKGLLRREFDLHTAESAREGLQILAEHPIDVVMTDQRMPEMTGVEMLCSVKTRYPDSIRIVFTGYADLKSVIEGVNHGGLHRYITKPWDPDELIDMLREAAAEHDELVECKQLFVDLREHVAQSRQFARQIAQRAASRELRDLDQQGSELLTRLEKRIAGSKKRSPGEST